MRRCAAVLVLLLASGCASTEDKPPRSSPGAGRSELTVYSGRTEDLIRPIIERFEKQSGIKVKVRYGDTAALASTLLEEGDRSPADVFLAQDAGALGAVSERGLFANLPASVVDRVPQRFRSRDGSWVGLSGRARVAVYNKQQLPDAEVPESALDLTGPKWKGKVGWAPTNGSFQAFVTYLRKLQGDDRARTWLQAMKANEAKAYQNNIAIVKAVAAGEIPIGLVNHYYLLELSREDPSISEKAANKFFSKSPGSLVNVAGAGVLKTSKRRDDAVKLLEFLLSDDGQGYFATKTFEYPLVASVKPDAKLPAIDSIQSPDVDLSDLKDLQGTLALLRETGVL
ncbi:MAG TPA: iron ABC transporter substrate-binding protein [Actinomycetota bacterium]|nr:iron ABC transporter substrate-binding protein [Actinomycetota bacterium]